MSAIRLPIVSAGHRVRIVSKIARWIAALVGDALIQIIAGLLFMLLIGALAAQLWLVAGVIAVVLVGMLLLWDRLGG